MKHREDCASEISALRGRLTRLSEACLRISESLDYDIVLQEVLDSARSLTGADYGVVIVDDNSGKRTILSSSGFTPREAEVLRDMPGRHEFLNFFRDIPRPLRVPDLHEYSRRMGVPVAELPVTVRAFVTVPIRHRREDIGRLYLGKQSAEEFTIEDEETLVMFGSQSALVIANARAYHEAQRARDRLETLVDISPTGIVVFDAATGALLMSNEETRRIVGSVQGTHEDIQGIIESSTMRRIDGSESSLSKMTIAGMANSAESTLSEEMEISLPDGRTASLLVNARPMLSEDDKVESVVATFQDLTPLDDLERLRAEFLGMVSHELRAPLMSIKGSSATLLSSLSSLDPDETLQFLGIIDSQADRMRDLITELLDVVRIETGSLSVSLEPTEVDRLVDEAVNSFRSGGSGHDIHIDLAPDLPRVMADKRRIVQVLTNLLGNAVKYSDETSAIRVMAMRENFHVAIVVADEGMGVPPQQLPYLFRKFSRVHEDVGRDVEGAGLGLAICKGIVEAHGGRVSADSGGLGQGAQFTFTLPMVDEPQSIVEAGRLSHSTNQSGSAGRRKRILVVDDDPQTLRYLRSTLSDADYEPTVTADPDQALRLVETHDPDLVLLDLMLPGIDGIQLMESMHRVADVPVIFISGYGRDQIIAKAFDMGAVDYMVKPFSSTELVARIRSALHRKTLNGQADHPEIFRLGALVIDYDERSVSIDDQSVELTAKEYDLIFQLSVNAGRALTHEQLLRRIWGDSYTDDPRVIRAVMRRLRRKLGDPADSPEYIFTAPRVGYRMRKPDMAEMGA